MHVSILLPYYTTTAPQKMQSGLAEDFSLHYKCATVYLTYDAMRRKQTEMDTPFTIIQDNPQM